MLKGFFVLSASLGLVLAGCSLQESPVSPQTQRVSALGKNPAPLAAAQQTLGGYLVTYGGRTTSGGNTSFSYSVTGIADGPALSQFVLQIPACAGALLASSPNGGIVGSDQASGVNGIKWGNVSVSNGQTESFSITFAGDVPEGLIRVAGKVGTDVLPGILPGPCQKFILSGTVFVDPDSSGTRDQGDEPGILADVTVTLVDDVGNVRTDVTDAAGGFAFEVIEGTHTLRIEAATPTVDFNEQLFDAFSATNSTSRTVVITGDSPNNDFGFKPKAKKIANDIALGVLPTTGKDRSFWIKVLRAVARGTSYGGYDAPAVLRFLQQIEAAFFPDPYQLTDGAEFDAALAILTANARTPLELLYRELFVTEMNDAAGRGLVSAPDLQDVLISWGEGLIIDRRTTPTLAKTGARLPSTEARIAPTTDTDVQSALSVFNNLNQRGGGDIPD